MLRRAFARHRGHKIGRWISLWPLEAVPDHPHSLDVDGLIGVWLDLLAQPTDVDIQRLRAQWHTAALDIAQQLIARHSHAAIAHQVGQQLKLLGRQL